MYYIEQIPLKAYIILSFLKLNWAFRAEKVLVHYATAILGFYPNNEETTLLFNVTNS